MRLSIVFGLVIGASVSAFAQDAVAPDLVGTWSGATRTVIFGHNSHHPGSETVASPPRVRDITYLYAFEGQDGVLLWGQSWSDPEKKEPFAASIAPDGKTIVGSDTDGSFIMTIASPDRLELCYTHSALGPSQSIVTSCGVLERQK